ncbi:MAG: hypothetical protein M1823_003113 [Watsoniomyces obsoletus]|nr:MAG: hypothetical protein M1823_003113 [Watsoniomyces obsoletus]
MDHFVRIMRPILQQHGAQVFDQAIRVIEVRDTFIKEDDRANARVAKLKIDESPKGREMEARFYDALEVIYFRVKGQLKQEVAKDVDMSGMYHHEWLVE